MVRKDHFAKQEAAANREAAATSRRTGNYRLDPFKEPEERLQRPSNCYGCKWDYDQKSGTYRLKFKHKRCYPQHEQPEQPGQAPERVAS